MSFDQDFRTICARRIREVRENIGETRPQFAKRLSIASSTYAKYETAETQPSLRTLVQIADIGNVSTDYLLARTNDRDQKFSVLDELGLTKESAQVLAYLHDKEEIGDVSYILNEIIEHEYFEELIFNIRAYLYLKETSFDHDAFYAAQGNLAEDKKKLHSLARTAGFTTTDIPVVLTDSTMATRLYRYEAITLFDKILRQLAKYHGEQLNFLDLLFPLDEQSRFDGWSDTPF